jgi:hypothetical protein
VPPAIPFDDFNFETMAVKIPRSTNPLQPYGDIIATGGCPCGGGFSPQEHALLKYPKRENN